jgi:hypothetical protein
MVPPVFGIRHLRPLASASASASSPVLKAAASVVSDAVIVGSPSPKASSISHGYRHIDHPLHHGFSIRPFRHPPSPHRPLQTRGKKTTTTIKLSDLPQGLIQPKPVSPPPTSSSVSSPHDESTEALPLPLPPLPQDPPAYPTVLLQARQNMLKFDNCVLLTRVGGFYELYFEHAEEFGPLLNIKVANKKTNAGLVPMVCLSLPSILTLSFHLLVRYLTIIARLIGRFSLLPARSFPQNSRSRSRSPCRDRGRVSKLPHSKGQVRWVDA